MFFPHRSKQCSSEWKVLTPLPLIVDSEGTLDTLEIQVELSEMLFSGADEIKVLQNIERQLKKDMKDYLGITAVIKLVEPRTIERSEGKASRIIDRRVL